MSSFQRDSVTRVLDAMVGVCEPSEEKPGEANINEEQLNGLTCAVCGRDDHPMEPISGIHSSRSIQIFRCCTCQCDLAELHRRIKGRSEAA